MRVACVCLVGVLFTLAIAAEEPGYRPGYFDLVTQAQAKSQAGAWTEAAALWEKVAQMNPVRGNNWQELARARKQARDYRKAIAAYTQAVELGYQTPFMAADIARCHAMLGDKEHALEWLDRALALRFADLELLQTDPELASLSDDPSFRKLVGLPDTSKMSREQGWAYDLELLRREVDRKGYSPYRTVSKDAFESAVKKVQDSVAKLTDIQLILEAMKLMRAVGDGHSAVWITANRPEFRTALPVVFYLFAEGVFIVSADAKHADLLGARVLSFGDQDTGAVLRALDALIPRDNEVGTLVTAAAMLRHPVLLHGLGLIPEAQSVPLTLRAMDGSARTVRLTTDSPDLRVRNVLPQGWVFLPERLEPPVPLYVKDRARPYWFEHLPASRTVYFQWNLVRDDPAESLAAFSTRLHAFIRDHDVDKLVIDLRWNNGGNTLLVLPLLHELIASDVNRRGKLFVIVGRRTFSAAQNAATLIERHTQAIFVGEPTGSSPNFVGEEDPVTLPYSKLQINVSDLFWQSSWPYDSRTWIGPEIYVPLTFAAFRANRDPALEAILEYPAEP
jgi:tetratricopeptide (TPR) repeat protein